MAYLDVKFPPTLGTNAFGTERKWEMRSPLDPHYSVCQDPSPPSSPAMRLSDSGDGLGLGQSFGVPVTFVRSGHVAQANRSPATGVFLLEQGEGVPFLSSHCEDRSPGQYISSLKENPV